MNVFLQLHFSSKMHPWAGKKFDPHAANAVMWQQECISLQIVFLSCNISHRAEQEQGASVFMPKHIGTDLISILYGKGQSY